MREQMMVFAKEIREVYRQERARSMELEAALERLREAYLSTVKSLAIMVEAKDVGTADHLDRTHQYATALAEEIDPELAERAEIGYGFMLHDIGKIAVPESVINKPGPLDPAEWALMKTHPVVGAQIVQPMFFLGEAVDIILYHHERFDGEGYPCGLKGDDIPLGSRIFSVVDSYDAMTSDRAYRGAMPRERALEEVNRGAGTQFDPHVVEVFVDLVSAGRVASSPASSL